MFDFILDSGNETAILMTRTGSKVEKENLFWEKK